jgi:putative CocE/NonD family hydrolase
MPLFLSADAPANSLHGGGRLLRSEPERSGSDGYRHDPTDPVPTRGGRHHTGDLPPQGPLDQRPVEVRNDVLVYTSEPLQQEVTLVGVVRARIRFESTASRADVTVKLLDVHPDGRALNVVDSIRRVDLVPGKAQLVDVAVGSTAMTFARGHRIRIELASSNWPQFDCVEAGDQVVHWGGRSGSRLLLPVYDG